MPSNVGAATFDIRGDNAQAIRAIREAAREAQRLLGGIAVKPTINLASLRSELDRTIREAQGLTVQVTADVVTRQRPAQTVDEMGRTQAQALADQRRTLALNQRLAREAAQAQAQVARDAAREQARAAQDAARGARESAREQTRAAQELAQEQVRLAREAARSQQEQHRAQVQAARDAAREQARAAQDAVRAQAQAEQTAARNFRDTQLLNQRLAREAAQAQVQGIQQLGRELQVAQSRYERGADSVRTYLREVQRIQAAGTAMASGLRAGSQEAQQLERVMSGLSRGTARINDQSIIKLKSDLAAARAEFERATAAAGRFNFLGQRQATQAYTDQLRALEQRIRSVGERSTATAAQIRSLNQMSAQIGSQRNAINGTFTPVGLSGNILNALRGLPQFAAQMGGSLGAAFSATTQLTGGLSALSALGGPVGVALGVVTTALVGLTAGLGKAVAEAENFQHGMGQISTLTDKFPQELGNVSQGILQMSASLGKPLGELQQGMYDILGAGVKGSEDMSASLKLLATSTKLAVAGATDTKTATDVLTSSLNAYGLSADKAGAISNKLFQAVLDGKMEFSQLAQSLGMVTPLAAQAGVSFDEVLAALAAMTKQGIKPATAVEYLRSALTNIVKPSEQAAKQAAAIGLEFDNAALRSKGFTGFMQDLMAKSKGNTAILSRLIGDVGGLTAVLSLGSGEMKSYVDILGNVEKATTTTDVAYAKATDNVKSASEKLSASWKVLLTIIGTPFLEGKKNLIDFATTAVQQFTAFAQSGRQVGSAFRQIQESVTVALAPMLNTVRDVFGAIATLWNSVLKPVLTALWQIWTVIQTAAVTALGIVLNVARSAITGVVGLVTGLVGSFVRGGKGVGDTLSTMSSRLATWAQTARAYIVGVGKIAGLLPEAFGEAGRGIGQIFAGIGKIFAGFGVMAYDALVKPILPILTTVRDAFRGIAEQIAEVVGNMLRWVGEKLAPLAEGLKSLGVGIGQTITNMLSGLAGNIRERLFGKDDGQAAALQAQAAAAKKVAQEQSGGAKLVGQGLQDIKAGYGDVRGAMDQFGQNARKVWSSVGDDLRKARAEAQGLRSDLSKPVTVSTASAPGRLVATSLPDATRLPEPPKKAKKAPATVQDINALDEYKRRLDAMTLKQLADEKLLQTRLKDTQRLRLVIAEIHQRERELAQQAAKAERERAAALKKAAAERQRDVQQTLSLGRRFYSLNEDFGLSVSKNKVTDESLQNYRQGVAGIRAEIEKLPKDLQAKFFPLLTQSKSLDASAQAALRLLGNIKAVTERVREMSVAELEAARVRWAGVPAAQALVKAIDSRLPVQRAKEYTASLETLRGALSGMTDAELQSRLATEQASDKQGKRLKLIQNEIEARRKLQEVSLQKGKLELQKGDAQAVVEDYERRVQLAQGNAQKLLSIEQQYGAEVLAARQRLAQVAAEEEILGIRERFRPLIEEARKHGQDTSRLEAQQGAAIQQARDRRDATQRQNKAQSDQQLIDLTQQAGDELFQIESEAAARRRGLRQQDTELVISGYETAKAAAQDNAAELLQVEQTLGREALAARQQQAQLAAEGEIAQINSTYRDLMEAARKRGEDTSALEAEQGRAIQAARDKRNAIQLANKVAFDQGLLDLTRQTTAELVRLANERLDALDAVENQHGQRTVSAYELAGSQATSGGTEDLAERLRVEQRLGQQVVAARQDMARRAADAEIRAQTEKYRVLLEKEEEGSDEYKRLQGELGQWIADREALLASERERIAWEGGQARIRAEKAVADAILQLNRDLTDGLNQRAQSEADRARSQIESDLAQDLRAAGENEAAKLQILQRSQGVREQMARQSINARMASEREAEERRWADLQKSSQWTAADQQLRERLTREHQNRLTEIARQGEFDKGQAVLQIRNQTEDQQQRVQEKRAQDVVKSVTRNLNDMTVQQRQSAEGVLRGWLTTFQAMGVAGQAAAKAIQDALDNVANVNSDARQRATELARGLFDLDATGRYANPETVTRTLADRTGKIGRPETRADAEAKGREAYSGEIDSLTKGIADAQKVIDELGKAPAGTLTAEQELALRMAQQYLPIFQTQLGKTRQAAQAAGQKAGQAFVDGLKGELTKAQDSGADAALQLAEANLKLANSQGLTGIIDYNAALQTYRDYWKGRMEVLRQGLATAQAAEAQARTALAGAKTPEAQAAAQDVLTKAITATATAQGELSTATTNYVSGQEKVIDVQKLSAEGARALEEARNGLRQTLGLSVPLYQSEIQSLDELIKKYPEQAFELGRVRAEYERIQKIRSAGIATRDSVKLDFQTGFNSGGENLQKAISGVAQGFGQMVSPMQIFTAILEKINPVGMALEGMFSVLEEPIKALQEPFRVIGTLLGSVLAPVLELIAPVLTAVADLFVVLYDAIAAFIKAISFGLVNIDRRNPNDTPERRKQAADLKGENDAKQLELDYRAGKVDRQKYEEERLRLLRERLDREMAAEIASAKETGADVGEIRRKYDLQYQEESAAIREEAAQRERDLAVQKGENDLADLERRRRQGLVSERQYEAEKYRLTLERLARERAAEIAAAEGDQRKILEINRRYDGLVLDAKLDMLDKLREAYRSIGEALMGAITGSLKDGLLNALKAGNFGQFRSEFRKNMRQAMFDAVLSAAIETAAIKGILQPAIDALTAAFQTEGTADDDAAIRGLLTAGSKVEGKMRDIYKAMKPLRDAWGIRGDASTEQTMTVTGQIDKPEVKISLDALAMLADVIQNHIPAYRDALAGHMTALVGHVSELKAHGLAVAAHATAVALHTPALSAHTAALPRFSTAVDAFGLHEAAHQQRVTEFGGHVGAFGGHVTAFGQHVQVLARAIEGGNSSFTPKR
ncbi:phage tail tape measure protein [Deinococcus sp. VB142]|uniref:Phage tail tape measure protein n=1 Tax=Deinococcus sp. VB142 TaxID=3112952 RepID=A0AAU6Q326_9DEIO